MEIWTKIIAGQHFEQYVYILDQPLSYAKMKMRDAMLLWSFQLKQDIILNSSKIFNMVSFFQLNFNIKSL